jgi:hypothetical protein
MTLAEMEILLDDFEGKERQGLRQSDHHWDSSEESSSNGEPKVEGRELQYQDLESVLWNFS